MCIRDRACVREVLEETGLQTAFVQYAFDYYNSPRLMHYFFCLLYTSDAADERSSVDLGGRRIIKKQTDEEQWEAVLDTRDRAASIAMKQKI